MFNTYLTKLKEFYQLVLTIIQKVIESYVFVNILFT